MRSTGGVGADLMRRRLTEVLNEEVEKSRDEFITPEGTGRINFNFRGGDMKEDDRREMTKKYCDEKDGVT